LFLFNYAADLSRGWARREERKRGERQNERERERREKCSARKRERKRESARATVTDRWTDRQRGKPKRGKWGGGRVGGALPSACCMGVMRRRGVGVNEVMHGDGSALVCDQGRACLRVTVCMGG
jgi:hypothetical protein